MNDFERAIKDISAVMNANKFELEKKNVSGAVPMPLRTVKEAYSALMFKQRMLKLLHDFEVENDDND